MIESLSVDFKAGGLGIFFKPYQVETLKFLMEHRNSSSKDVYNHLLFTIEMLISRASIINFLNNCVDMDICDFEVESGKGGMHRLYIIKLNNENKLVDYMFNTIQDKWADEVKARV